MDTIYPGMVLEHDLYNSRGTLLAQTGTLLTEDSCVRLARAGVHVVNLKLPKAVDRASKAADSIPAEKMREFSTFKTTYENKEKEVSDCLIKIGNGEQLDIAKTFTLTDSIISKLSNKNDIFLFLEFMKDFDNHTFSHCSNVALLCYVFGGWLGMDRRQLTELTVAGMLHDVGKTRVPIEILNKKGKLTPEEFKIIKDHTVLGYKLLLQQELTNDMRLAALQHHEKTDGSGYPLGIDGTKINRFAKIVAICDIYDAMTSTRSYREKICPFEVIHTFETGLYGALDPKLLFMFLNSIAYVYLNSTVVLSDGREAEVMFIPKETPSKPIVKTSDGTMLNLTEHDLKILRIK
ncbi:MAG: HD-GYP domain-containing protein [Oscillospiraceae bacterium]|nr:HD-GYP domain-containing protein [Oscillospiraceae bacterium]